MMQNALACRFSLNGRGFEPAHEVSNPRRIYPARPMLYGEM